MENTMKLDTSAWKKVKLGDILDNISDKGHPELPVLTVLHGTGVIPRDEYYGNTSWDKSDEALAKYKACNKYDFINDLSTYKDGMEMCEYRGLVSPAYSVLRIRDNSIAIPMYLKYMFVSSEFIHSIQPIVPLGARVGKNIPWKDKQNIEIKLPTLEEQRKIAEALTTLDTLIEVRGGQRKMIAEQKSQLMTEIFSQKTPREEWKTVKLGDIAKFKAGGTPSSKYPEYYDGDIPFVGVNDITKSGKYIEITEKYITDDAVKSCSTWIAKAGTLVYSLYGSIGYASIVNVDFAMNQNLVTITELRNDVDKEFLYYTLSRLRESGELDKITSDGAVKHISVTTLKSYEIELPPLSEQKKIAKLLSDYDELIQTKRTGLANIEKSKAQLMNSIFTEREREFRVDNL